MFIFSPEIQVCISALPPPPFLCLVFLPIYMWVYVCSIVCNRTLFLLCPFTEHNGFAVHSYVVLLDFTLFIDRHSSMHKLVTVCPTILQLTDIWMISRFHIIGQATVTFTYRLHLTYIPFLWGEYLGEQGLGHMVDVL